MKIMAILLFIWTGYLYSVDYNITSVMTYFAGLYALNTHINDITMEDKDDN